MKKVIAYIDGFNLYYGLRDARYRKYFWLDLCSLVQDLNRANQVVSVKYFTARINSRNAGKRKRQTTFIEALRAKGGISIIEGRYESRPYRCPICRKKQSCGHCKILLVKNEEKMTDVNIATEMLIDAATNMYDEAFLVSGDCDLKAAVVKSQSVFHKKVRIGFPPKRKNKELAQVASNSFVISETKLRNNQLPPKITKADGFELIRPATWK